MGSLKHASTTRMPAGFTPLTLLLSLVLGQVSSEFQPSWGFRSGTTYTVCQGIDGTSNPLSCLSTSQDQIYGSGVGTSLQILFGGCGPTTLFNLFDGGANPDVILQRHNSVTTMIIDPSRAFMSITCFDVCCNNIFFVDGDQLYVQNMDVETRGIITKLLFQINASPQFLQVDCRSNAYHIFYSVNGDGLYRIDMDSDNLLRILDYEGRTIDAFDYNAHNGLFALVEGGNLYVWDYGSYVSNNFPVLFSDTSEIVQWLPTAVVAVTVATAPDGTPFVVSSSTIRQPNLRASTGPGDTVTLTGTSSLPVNNVNDLYFCYVEDDCLIGCDDCPCSNTNQYQECCTGLCVPHQPKELNRESYSCFCRSEDLFRTEQCTATSGLSSYPSTCPLDVIGAVECPYTGRNNAFSVYALSISSTTSICLRNEKLPIKQQRKSVIPIVSSLGPFGVLWTGYQFPATTVQSGSRFGVYDVTAVENSLGGFIPVIAQEQNNAILSDDVTVTSTVGSAVRLIVRVVRQCNTRRLRWLKDGNHVAKYNRKTALVFHQVAIKDGGIYESYLSSRLHRFWRLIIRLIVRPEVVSGTTCTAGVLSYDGRYCICPPGLVGRTCEFSCPAGRFGSLGQCGFSCADIFGSENADCSNILFCLPDPAGCQCYPGFRLPDCRRKIRV